ncbi:MAG: hypothetical protein M1816_002936 [Peltula sp. TS41687]|nr:MAG: hypothetical protein M1816_002936 [Peltula sp. TS41687]
MHSPTQEWYYVRDHMPSEILIFKCVDSEKSVVSACPHAGFFNPKAGAKDIMRESIDCRAFVLYADTEEFPVEIGTVYQSHME